MYLYICISISIYTQNYTHIYIHTYKHTHIYIYIYIYIYNVLGSHHPEASVLLLGIHQYYSIMCTSILHLKYTQVIYCRHDPSWAPITESFHFTHWHTNTRLRNTHILKGDIIPQLQWTVPSRIMVVTYTYTYIVDSLTSTKDGELSFVLMLSW